MQHHNLTFAYTRSCAALRAADLDWIDGPGYSLGREHSLFVFQYYFFAKSDLDLSIVFFLYFLPKNIMFYPIITTLDGEGGAGQE